MNLLTALHQRLASEGRILTRDWELYDGQHVVFRPEGARGDGRAGRDDPKFLRSILAAPLTQIRPSRNAITLAHKKGNGPFEKGWA